MTASVKAFPTSAFNGDVLGFNELPNGKLLVYGYFTKFLETTVPKIVLLNSDYSLDTLFLSNIGTGPNYPPQMVTSQSDNTMLIGGSFSSWNGVTVKSLVKLSASGVLDTTFTSNIGTGSNIASMQALVSQTDNKILVGGYFDLWNGTTVNGIVRLNSNGTIDTSFVTNIGSSTGTTKQTQYIVVRSSDGKIFVSGPFTTWNGAANKGFIALNSDGTVDTSYMTKVGTGPTSAGNITSMGVQPSGGLIVGGYLTSWNGTTVPRIAPLNSDGSLNTQYVTNMGTGPNDGVHLHVSKYDGSVIVSLYTRPDLAKWNGVSISQSTDNTVFNRYIFKLSSSLVFDSSFNIFTVKNKPSGYSRYVSQWSAISNNKIILCGSYNRDFETPTDYITCLNLDGTVKYDFIKGFASVKDTSVKVLGAWRSVTKGYVKVSGSWRQYFDRSPVTVDYLLIGGGASNWNGPGQNSAYGGGGAGGYLEGSKTLKFGDKLNISIGAGGAPGSTGGSTYVKLTPYMAYEPIYQGVDNIFLGGNYARAASHYSGSLQPPGSGTGGGCYMDFYNWSFSAISQLGHDSTQGNAGGNAQAYYSPDFGQNMSGSTGGGGGAGGVGVTSTNRAAPNGGVGRASSITGTSVYRAAGGGGGAWRDTAWGDYLPSAPRGNGGNGGGGAGGTDSIPPTSGTANTGSGGGGACGTTDYYAATNISGNGGSGVFIIRYPNTYPDISYIPIGLQYTRTTPAGYKVYQFTGGIGEVIL